MSTRELIDLFHHRWAPPALALVAERKGVRFVELQRTLGVGRESLRRALDALLDLELVARNPGYGHPLRPEYVITARGRRAAPVAAGVLAAGNAETLLRKWSVPVLAELRDERRFSELRASLPGVTPRALALALRDLEDARLVRREVRPTRPPSTVYRTTARGARVLRHREDDLGARSRP
ncbi:MAG TPA: helix-turn-helix domain-containing protein [Gaiellaceae bacterium]|nr:helix-turn-helix domain-containing protein [Gaiellaceae bacterium]